MVVLAVVVVIRRRRKVFSRSKMSKHWLLYSTFALLSTEVTCNPFAEVDTRYLDLHEVHFEATRIRYMHTYIFLYGQWYLSLCNFFSFCFRNDFSLKYFKSGLFFNFSATAAARLASLSLSFLELAASS